jgi:hypothetical protein
MHIIFMCLRCGLHDLCCFCFNKFVPAKRLLKFQREILYILSHLLTLYIFTDFHFIHYSPMGTLLSHIFTAYACVEPEKSSKGAVFIDRY